MVAELLIPGGDEEPGQGWAGLHHCCPLPVQIDLPATMSISRGLPGQYRAVQMHLHWGGLDLESSGSEHTIDGMRYFAEVSSVCHREGGSALGNGGCIPQGLQERGSRDPPGAGAGGGLSLMELEKAPRKAMVRTLCPSAVPPQPPQTC